MDALVAITLLFAGISWFCGEFSVFGGRLQLRRGRAWLFARCLGAWLVASSGLYRIEYGEYPSHLGILAGAMILLIGVSRKRLRKNSTPRPAGHGDDPFPNSPPPPPDEPVPAPLSPRPILTGSDAKELPELEEAGCETTITR